MWLFKFLAWASAATQVPASTPLTYGPPSFAPPGPFPTSLYKSYYNNPTATASQPQPVISDPVLVRIYPVFRQLVCPLIPISRTKYTCPNSLIRRIYPRYFFLVHHRIITLTVSFLRRIIHRIPSLSQHAPLMHSSSKAQ